MTSQTEHWAHAISGLCRGPQIAQMGRPVQAQLEDRHWWFRGRRRILQAVVERLLSDSKRRLVIDVGCGTGANLASLADVHSRIGVDVSVEAIALARARFPEVQFEHVSSLSHLGQAVTEADLFLLMDVLEHVPDDFALLSEVAAAARPGAHLLITVPADESLWSNHDLLAEHYRRYSPQRLEMLWRDLPVTVRLLAFFNSRLYPIVKIIRSARWLSPWMSGVPPYPLNAFLERVFAGEARVLVDLLDGRRSRGHRRGVSLFALLRRESGDCSRRSRLADAPPDMHGPFAASARKEAVVGR